MRKKYAKKSKSAQFFHKNTGFIVMGIFALVIVIIWFYFDSQQMFFDNWSCLNITKLALNFNAHERLTEIEHERFDEILESCFDDKQFFRFDH